MKLSLILEAIDRWSAPAKKAKGSTDGLVKATGQLERASSRAGSRVMAFWRDAERGERIGRKLGIGLRILAFYGFDRVKAAAWGATKAVAKFGLTTVKNVAIGGMYAAGGGLVAGLYKVVSAGMTFEKFRTQLTGLQGSVAAGNKAMDWVTDFARKTPYELDEVMSAFIQLKAYGIDPTDGSLQSLGNTAAGMGKDLMSAVEMIADAMTGEFERLKEFGVKASQKGNQVTLSYMKDGKAMTVRTTKNAADIKKALMGIFDGRFAGGMDRLAATTEGKWSNVMDRITIMSKQVWESGFGASVNKQLDRLAAWIDSAARDGSLQRWADQTGKSIGQVVDAIGRFDWQGFAGDVRSLAGAFQSLAGAIDKVNAVGKFLDDATGWWGAKEKLWGKNGDIIRPERGSGQWNVMPQNWGAPMSPNEMMDWRKRNPVAPAIRRPGEGVLRRDRPMGPLIPTRPPTGTVKISLEVPPGFRARTTGLSAKGMDLQFNTGRAMGGVA